MTPRPGRAFTVTRWAVAIVVAVWLAVRLFGNLEPWWLGLLGAYLVGGGTVLCVFALAEFCRNLWMAARRHD